MYFDAVNNSEKPTDLGIKIFFKNNIIYKDNPRLRQAVYVHIKHLIGEIFFANDIAFIEIGQLGSNSKNLIELFNLKL